MAEIDWSSSCGPHANAHPPPPIAHAPTPIGVNSISLLPSRFFCISSTITELTHPAGTRAVVIGSGPNGLAAAIVLARAGQAVTLYEGAPTIGGGARSAALTLPGFVHDICAAVHPLAVCSPCFEQFPLAGHGLEWVHPDAPLAHPLDDGTAVLLERSIRRTAANLGHDGAAWRALFEPFADAWPRLRHDVLAPPGVPRHPLLLAKFGMAAIRPARSLAETRFRGDRAGTASPRYARRLPAPVPRRHSAGLPAAEWNARQFRRTGRARGHRESAFPPGCAPDESPPCRTWPAAADGCLLYTSEA